MEQRAAKKTEQRETEGDDSIHGVFTNNNTLVYSWSPNGARGITQKRKIPAWQNGGM